MKRLGASFELWPGAGRGRVEAGEFRCLHCRRPVLTDWTISGVRNRNHCPYCLHSRHLDLRRPGDRLAACKGAMAPVGLTLKRVHKKYGPQTGELMLIHACRECGQVSINRIAADDDWGMVMDVLRGSGGMDGELRRRLGEAGITVMEAESEAVLVG